MVTVDKNCAYCGNAEVLNEFGVYMCDLVVSKLYFFKEQSHLGRVIVAYNDHIDDITDLSVKERSALFEDINKVSLALKKTYNPIKVNYGMYNDAGHHLHCHLVTKYIDEFEYKSTFTMNPHKFIMGDEQIKVEIAKIISNL